MAVWERCGPERVAPREGSEAPSRSLAPPRTAAVALQRAAGNRAVAAGLAATAARSSQVRRRPARGSGASLDGGVGALLARTVNGVGAGRGRMLQRMTDVDGRTAIANLVQLNAALNTPTLAPHLGRPPGPGGVPVPNYALPLTAAAFNGPPSTAALDDAIARADTTYLYQGIAVQEIVDDVNAVLAAPVPAPAPAAAPAAAAAPPPPRFQRYRLAGRAADSASTIKKVLIPALREELEKKGDPIVVDARPRKVDSWCKIRAEVHPDGPRVDLEEHKPDGNMPRFQRVRMQGNKRAGFYGGLLWQVGCRYPLAQIIEAFEEAVTYGAYVIIHDGTVPERELPHD